jgi:hypothetical protein
MFSFITIPTATTSPFFKMVGAIIGDLWVLLAIVIGVPVAFYIIRKAIGIVPKSRK